MSSGYDGTPFVGAVLNQSLVSTFRHDVGVLLGDWQRIVSQKQLRGSVWALWAEPWDGANSLLSIKLDPFFIPLARLIRLGAPGSKGSYETLWFRTSTKRVRDHTEGGDFGDPFLPLVPKPKSDLWKAHATGARGYSYVEVVYLLFGEQRRPVQRAPSVQALVGLIDQDDRPKSVVFEGICFEEGGTNGFHRRIVSLRSSAIELFEAPDLAWSVHERMHAAVRKSANALYGAGMILLRGKLRAPDMTRVSRCICNLMPSHSY